MLIKCQPFASGHKSFMSSVAENVLPTISTMANLNLVK